MDLTMDVQNELDFQFLDLHDLNDNDRNHLIGILKSNIVNDTLKLPWDTAETNSDVNISITEIPQIHNQWYHNAIPPPPSYTQQIMCNDWQRPPIYPVPTDTHIQPFMPAMTYSHPGYNIGGEIHDVSCNRETNRRNNRGKGIRRDNFNHGINPGGEMQPGYMGEQGQFHPQLSFVVMYPDQTQQQQFSGHVHYPPLAIYQPNIHTHTSTHPHAQPTYGYPPYHHPSGNIRCVRQVTPMLSQPTQECTKVQTTKSHEKRIQNTYTPVKQPFHQVNEEDNSSQTNIVTTVITVNNSKVEQCTDNVDENTVNRKNSNTNGKVPPVNVKIEHNIVSTVNEKCNGAEKNDVPCVNINSSIEVKQNGETDKEYKNETVSSIKTTVVKTLSKPVSKNESEAYKEDSSRKNVQDEVVIKTPNSSVTSTPIIVPTTSSPALSSISWASILKKGSADTQSSSSNYKPTARINPLPITENNVTSKITSQSTEKDQLNSTTVFTNENISSNLPSIISESKNSQADSLQNHYNDPIAFRMGEFLLNYQMDKQTVSLLPRGLTNRSNYCYINSILQALLACPPFYNLLMALPHSKNPSKMSSTPLIDNMIKFVHEFTPLSDGARLARKDRANKRGEDTVVDIQSGVAFEPFYVYTMLKNTSAAGVFSVEGRQEDAEEFLSCLLNGINDEMLELIKLVNNDQNVTNNIESNVNYNNGEEEWKVMGPKNKGSITRCTEFGRTPLSDIFRGQLRSRVSRAGEQPTDNVQPFFTLQLDIEKAESVKGALEILVGKDQLEGMTCSKTKQQIEAWKQVTLEELPVILILHLKWFDYKLDVCSKIVKSVEFPIDLKLDSKFLSPNTVKKLNPKQKHYKLFAVTYHDGKEATKGHYVTDAFHVGYGGWVRYDDSSLKGVSESNVLKPTPPRVPYLLYYRRCDTIGNNQSNSAKTR
ncbi:PREDICTED: ubiquitin carboxyl-terminal hydrolase 10-like [Eufriesea mexicana]|uniref:ubiquitin carboxyl-terminal hydrolase 10-like n=1 Tax=Eufriesea mexicana TaxID=516756 RepID=UPI00083C8A00|nr:PREDICTED: ubiquitin carboxyl-terminal hydrolase 10-like [Eufriesea mexicana]